MSRRKKKGKIKVDITSFIFESQREEVKKGKKSETEDVFIVSDDIEVQLINFIRSQGRVKKSKIYQWSKERDVTPASLYKALMTLERKGLIKKKFDENVEELVYVVL